MDSVHPAVAAHGRRVSALSVTLATQYGLPQPMVETIRVGAALHDIGKILIPKRLLSKPGRLTDREWGQLQNHPALGIELLERFDFSPAVIAIVLGHHERPDGLGYPNGLEGHEIGWPVRIVSVMDAFDALTSPRAYRQALSVEAARSLVAREAGSRYCAWAVSGLLSLPMRLLEPLHSELAPPYVLDGCPTEAAAWATEAWTATSF